MCALTNLSSKHPNVDQLAKMASVWRLCWSSVAYSHHRVAGKTSIKDKRSVGNNVEPWRRLTESHVCKVQAESWKFREPYLGSEVDEGLDKLLAEIQTFITHHYITLTSLLYRVRTLTSHNTEESENSPESPHLGEIKHMCKQCVPGASPFFARAR